MKIREEILLHKNTGFTIAELLVIIAIIGAIAFFVLANVRGYRGKKDVDAAAARIVALLREAQSRSMSQSQSVSWGVRFQNTTTTPAGFSLFTLPYVSSTVLYYQSLPAGVVYSSSTLAVGTSTDITFAEITGFASASTSITLFSVSQSIISSTIRISSSGAVSF